MTERTIEVYRESLPKTGSATTESRCHRGESPASEHRALLAVQAQAHDGEAGERHPGDAEGEELEQRVRLERPCNQREDDERMSRDGRRNDRPKRRPRANVP